MIPSHIHTPACSAAPPAADHDFAGSCLTPSVLLVHDVPDSVEGSWLQGRVLVGVKDAVFQKSNCWRHEEELYRLLAPLVC